jgi:hypothetical protein
MVQHFMLIRSYALRYNLRLTVAVLLEYNLGVQFAILHPHQEFHPGQDLRHRRRQDPFLKPFCTKNDY